MLGFKTIKKYFSRQSAVNGYEQALRHEGLFKARNVGGTFALADKARESLKSMGIDIERADEAMVFVTNHDEATCGAYLVTKSDDDKFRVISLVNYGRPDDRMDIDRIEARRSAHRMRELLKVIADVKRPEHNKILNYRG